MKIAVSAQGQTLQDAFDPSFGRCSGFVIYDTDAKTASFVDNSQNQSAAQGAGIQAAQAVSASAAEVLITGQVGPKAMQALSHSQLHIFSSSAGTVQEAIQAWEKNELQPITTASGGQAPGGQGMGRGGGGRGRGPDQGGRGMGGGARGRGPGQGGQGLGGGAQGRGPGQGGRGQGGAGKGRG
ncbi:NifB/NifX family molybdenum-iron cluster-binding protein [Desulfovermiculus halophilus]|uniref:NifB/NifX family molybdenum-iron cluster-binding protein n=1 Tax=Desulfovermiculus halophilus TaxID=339722 RepID=UPI0004829A8E|nr:NifB/NifX family molybdenum-iron cluster-binding protein [Desulfovermiculus halophilus]